jgi:hypothetical protein
MGAACHACCRPGSTEAPHTKNVHEVCKNVHNTLLLLPLLSLFCWKAAL